MEDIFIIVINPGSTSTKIAVYRNKECIFEENIKHSAEELAPYEKITDQFEFRKQAILHRLNGTKVDRDKVRVIMGRGGLVHPIESGVYRVNEKMKYDLVHSPVGEHASNLGGFIAEDLAKEFPNAVAYITDPVVVDEMDEIARIAGHPAFTRRSVFHALNQKATARRHSIAVGKKYEELKLIVVHLGGGITVGAHKKGRVIDVNQGLDGEGPFTPERSGTLPVGALIRLCFSGKYTLKEVLAMNKGYGGLVAHLGTNNAAEVEKMVEAGDAKAKMIYDAMAYQVAKYIGEMYAVLKCEVDAILITGGIAYDKKFVSFIQEHVHKIAPVHVFPGEDEMRALAMNGLFLIKGELQAKEYK